MLNKSLPLVSVVIPAYNAGSFITATLDSIVNQTYPNLEIIVVDDGSTDNTRAVVESYSSNIQYIYQNNSGGCSSPRNHGFKYAKGELIHFFDADDLMSITNIQEKVEYILNHPDIGFVCSDFSNFRARNDTKNTEPSHFSTCSILSSKLLNLTSENSILISGSDARKIMLQESFSNAGSVMFPRDVFEKVGGFDEALTSSEDFDINYRTLLNFDCGIINSIGFYRRLHEDNMTANPVKMYTNGILSTKKLLKLETHEDNQRMLKKRIIVRLMGLARYYRSTHSLKSLSYSIKSLRYIQAFNTQTYNQLLRNVIAAILRRS